MEFEREKLVGVWSRLKKGGQEAAGISIPTIGSDVLTASGPIRYALGANGEPRVLLPIGLHDKPGQFQTGGALDVHDGIYQQNGRPVRFLDVTCSKPALGGVFSDFAAELLSRIREGSTCADALRSTLSDFRALLLDSLLRAVSDAEIIGLAGELLILLRLLKISPDAWESWRGPLGERHDFRRNLTSLEIKTATRTSNQIVSISAIDQLEAPSGGKLFLGHVVLEKAVGSKLSVATLFKEALELTSLPEKLWELVGALGCSDPYSEEWNRLSFNEERVAFYAVEEGFPRITSSSFLNGQLPDGVCSVEYEIDLCRANSYILSLTEESTMQQEIAG